MRLEQPSLDANRGNGPASRQHDDDMQRDQLWTREMDVPTTHTLTRQELYDLVWSAPIAKLSKQFGVSDRGLTKICLRHQIPVPGRGYWAKIEAGQSATRTPLWRIENPGIETVCIGGLPPDVNPYVAFAINATRSAKQTLEKERKASTNTPAMAHNPAAVSTPQRPLHPSLRDFARELSSAIADRTGALNVRWVSIHRDSIGRVISLLNALAHEFESHGITFAGHSRRVAFKNDDASVDFEITSPKKRVTTETPYGWKQYENVFVGRLAFRIFGRAQGVKKNWVDTDSKKIEISISQIVESYRINLDVQKAYDEKERAERLQREHLAHRRHLAEKRAAREEARLGFLHAIANDRREVEYLKLTIDAVPRSDSERHEYERMLIWATARLAVLKERTSVDSLQQALIDQNLFPEPDDLYDPEGEPPAKTGYWD